MRIPDFKNNLEDCSPSFDQVFDLEKEFGYNKIMIITKHLYLVFGKNIQWISKCSNSIT